MRPLDHQIDATRTIAPRTTPGHLTAPSRQGWHLWRTFECRTAGFPLADVLTLADDDAATAADALLRARRVAHDAWEGARSQLKTAIREGLGQARALEPSPQRAAVEDRVARLRKACASIERKRLDESALDALGAAAAQRLLDHSTALADARQRYDEVFAQAQGRVQERVAALAGDKRLREAVAWQNPALLETVFDALLPGAQASNYHRRRGEELVASYVQRYGVKNDTIGFFGPVGWGRIEDGRTTLASRHGEQLLRTRRVYFEDWAVAELARTLAARGPLRRWCVVRRLPYVRQDGAALRMPGGALVRLDARRLAVLAACDGKRRAIDVARLVSMNPFGDFDGEDDALALVETLVGEHRVTLGFDVAAADAWPERALRRQLQAVEDGAARAEALRDLDALEQARAALGAAAGDPDDVRAAFAELGRRFEAITDRPDQRHAGQTYGARTLAYEDTVRDLDVVIGDDLLPMLHPPLDLVLAASRWFCHRLGGAWRAAFRASHQQLAARSGPSGGPVPFADFWLDVQAHLFGEAALDTRPIEAELVERWQSVLGAEPGQRRVERRSGDLDAAVHAAFAAPDSGWRLGRHHSPDVMIAASDEAAFQRGEGLFVLGEVHVGINTLINQSALNQHDAPETLLAALSHDHGGPRVIPLLSQEGAQQPIRVQTVYTPGHDLEMRFSRGVAPRHADSAIDISELVVVEDGDTLRVRTRDAGVDQDLMDVVGEFLSGIAAAKFRLHGPAPRLPRVTIDRLVVQRESWSLPCDGLDLALPSNDEAGCMLALREWRERHEFPRFVFIRFPWERKPAYFDFDSPLFLRTLGKLLRKAGRPEHASRRIGVTEMLPGHDEAWLRDRQGRAYTSELRLVAVHGSELASPAHS